MDGTRYVAYCRIYQPICSIDVVLWILHSACHKVLTMLHRVSKQHEVHVLFAHVLCLQWVDSAARSTVLRNSVPNLIRQRL